MKKHPVDDLFKRRFEGMERTPSESAWLKIQERQLTKSRAVNRRSVAWGWYAAAGVAAAVMGGYLVWQNGQFASPGIIRSNQTIAAAKPTQKDSAVTPVENLNAPSEHIAAAEKVDNGSTNDQKGLKPTLEASKIDKTQRAAKQVIDTPNADSELHQNLPVMALNENASIPVNTIQPEPMNSPVAQDIKTLPDEPAVSRVNKPEPEQTRMIVVAVETGNNEVEEKPRNSRFSRVFRQLKNARAGEKVDWDEVGFNPKNLVARVDDRLRNKDERSSDKDHPKDKTKL